MILSHRGEHLENQLGFEVICQAIGATGHAQICYGGTALFRGPDKRYQGEVPNPYAGGAVPSIGKFYDCVTRGDFSSDTVRRSLDGARATILGREAALGRTRLTWEDLLKESRPLELDLRGLRT